MKQETKTITNEERFRGVALLRGIEQPEIFVRFMVLRFPEETCNHYIAEWVRRFKSGNPIPFMDLESRNAYIQAVTETAKTR